MSSKRNSVAQVNFLLLAIGALGIAGGCGTSTSTTPPIVQAKNIYVTQTGSVEVFPIATNGNVAPTTTITDATNAFGDAHRTAFDSSGKLYVVDAGSVAGSESIVVFSANATGAATPTATITGTATGLHHSNGIALDAQGRIYVTNIDNSQIPPVSSVTIYAAGATGNATPTTTITGSNTQLDDPNGITLDSNGKIYVANEGTTINATGSVTVYPAGSTGNATPSAVITGATSAMNSPHAVALDSSGKIYVTNAPASVNIYAAGTTGNVAPSTTISGANTGLSNPNGITVDPEGNIYVVSNTFGGTDVGFILVFPASATGNVAPSATITGATTGLDAGNTVVHGISVR